MKQQREKLKPTRELPSPYAFSFLARRIIVTDFPLRNLPSNVPNELEWLNELNAGNSFTASSNRTSRHLCPFPFPSLLTFLFPSRFFPTQYYFCTKCLPLITSAAIDDPSPSIYASPSDLLRPPWTSDEHSSASVLLPWSTRESYPASRRPLQEVLYGCSPGEPFLDLPSFQLKHGTNRADSRRVLRFLFQNLDMHACFTDLLPHLPDIHTYITASYNSPLSAPSQKRPPPPLKTDDVARFFPQLMQPLFETVLTRYQELPWAAWLHVNMLAFQAALGGLAPPAMTLGTEGCRSVGRETLKGCRERDPKKMKACSKMSANFSLFIFLSDLKLTSVSLRTSAESFDTAASVSFDGTSTLPSFRERP